MFPVDGVIIRNEPMKTISITVYICIIGYDAAVVTSKRGVEMHLGVYFLRILTTVTHSPVLVSVIIRTDAFS